MSCKADQLHICTLSSSSKPIVNLWRRLLYWLVALFGATGIEACEQFMNLGVHSIHVGPDVAGLQVVDMRSQSVVLIQYLVTIKCFKVEEKVTILKR